MDFTRVSSCFLLCIALACSGTSENNQAATTSFTDIQAASPSRLTAEEKADGWKFLFDGENLENWRSAKSDSFPSKAWVIEDGALVLAGKGGDIVTKEKYGNFELAWEFNLTDGSNSGIKYFVDSITHRTTGATVINGPEYQIIDDLNYEGIKDDPNGLSSTGSLYLLYAPENKTLRPAGQWNNARIIAKNGEVEHWLNGRKVLSYQKGSEDFRRKIVETKFKDYPDYGLATEGHILLTDHQDQVYFRNIKIRKL